MCTRRRYGLPLGRWGTFARVSISGYPQIYPTLVRSTGLGSSVTMSRLGAIITPFVANMFDSTDQVRPFLSCHVFNFASAFRWRSWLSPVMFVIFAHVLGFLLCPLARFPILPHFRSFIYCGDFDAASLSWSLSPVLSFDASLPLSLAFLSRSSILGQADQRLISDSITNIRRYPIVCDVCQLCIAVRHILHWDGDGFYGSSGWERWEGALIFRGEWRRQSRGLTCQRQWYRKYRSSIEWERNFQRKHIKI